MPSPATLTRIVTDELADHVRARGAGDIDGGWCALERAHVASQQTLRLHMRVHLAMLSFAIRLRDPREIAGQLARLALAPLGAITGRVPKGNTGRSDVSPFRPMPIPPDLAARMNDEEHTR